MSTKNAMNIMKAIAVCLFSVIILVESNEYLNVTYQPAHRQLLDFKKEHPVSRLVNGTDFRQFLLINSNFIGIVSYKA